jgi:hypothetical protein
MCESGAHQQAGEPHSRRGEEAREISLQGRIFPGKEFPLLYTRPFYVL